MTSTLRVDTIVNEGGDNDSGIDLSTNDKVAIKIADSEVATVDTSGVVFNDGSVDRDFRIESNGNANMIFVDGGNDVAYVGGATDFQGTLNVAGDGVGVGNSTSSYRRMYWNTSNTDMRFWNGSNEAIINDSGAFTDASDEKLKKDIADITYGIDIVKALKPRKYKMKDTDKEQVGFIAQEVEAHVPEVVTTGTNPNGVEQKGLSYGQLTAVLAKALQEAVAKIETLEAEVAKLKG